MLHREFQCTTLLLHPSFTAFSALDLENYNVVRLEVDNTSLFSELRLSGKLSPERSTTWIPAYLDTQAVNAAFSLIWTHIYQKITAIDVSFHWNTTPFSAVLDKAALFTLNVLPHPSMSTSGRYSSLFAMLNHCKTRQGNQLLQQWLSHPLVTAGDILFRQDIVVELFSHSEWCDLVRKQVLHRMPDLSRIIQKWIKKTATLEDVVTCYQSILLIPILVSLLDSTTDDYGMKKTQDAFASVLQHLQQELAKFCSLVEDTLDLDAIAQHQFIIKPAFDDTLLHLRDQQQKYLDHIHQAYHTAMDQLGFCDADKKLKLEENSVYGYCMRLTRNVGFLLRVIFVD